MQSTVAMNCYPTSFVKEVSIKFDHPVLSGARIEVVNTLGQKVYSSTASFSGKEPMVLNLEAISAGYYFVRIANGNKMEACRVVKK